MKNSANAVAIILAFAIGLALNMVTAAVLWAAYWRLGVDPDSGLSENATQLLSGAFSGIISVLAAYVGYTVGKKHKTDES